MEENNLDNFFHVDLITATLSKDPDTLREAINRAHKHNYNMALTVQILLAGRLLERYLRMKRIENTVIDMNQNAVTEMKKYTKPPNGVHQTLGATFLLLGEEASVVKVSTPNRQTACTRR